MILEEVSLAATLMILFFVDTNFVVASTDVTHKHHKACKTLLYYFVQEDIQVYISDLIISESMHVLARAMYIDEQVPISIHYPREI